MTSEDDLVGAGFAAAAAALARRFGACGTLGGPPPENASHAVEARPFRLGRPLIFLFASEGDACRFAEAIGAWPGPLPSIGRIEGPERRIVWVHGAAGQAVAA